jgi:hypothetical protein
MPELECGSEHERRIGRMRSDWPDSGFSQSGELDPNTPETAHGAGGKHMIGAARHPQQITGL